MELLGLDISFGAVSARDTARDADTASMYGEGLPVFRTKAECQKALRHAIQKYAGLSHAEGNDGWFLCSDWRTWGDLDPMATHDRQPEQAAIVFRSESRPEY